MTIYGGQDSAKRERSRVGFAAAVERTRVRTANIWHTRLPASFHGPVLTKYYAINSGSSVTIIIVCEEPCCQPVDGSLICFM